MGEEEDDGQFGEGQVKPRTLPDRIETGGAEASARGGNIRERPVRPRFRPGVIIAGECHIVFG